MKKKTVVSVTAVAMLFAVSLFFVGGTYARYVSEFDGEAKVDVAAWKVSLSGGDGAEEGNIDLTLTADENDNVVKDKIAPSVSASGTLEVDLDGTEVAVDLFVDVDENAIKNALTTAGVKDVTNSDISLEITAKGKEGATNVLNHMSGSGTKDTPYVITLPEGHTSGFTTGDVVEITVKVTWENQDVNSADHTKIGEKAGESGSLTLSVPVKLYVVQHILESNYNPGV